MAMHEPIAVTKFLVKPNRADFFVHQLHAKFVDNGLADRIRSIMGEMQWSARELARQAGLKSGTHVSTILKTGGAHPDTLIKIADAGRVQLAWLLTGNGDRRAEERLPMPPRSGTKRK